MIKFPRVYFGKYGKPNIDWRGQKPEPDPDDELVPMDESSIKMLGFDPAKYKINEH